MGVDEGWVGGGEKSHSLGLPPLPSLSIVLYRKSPLTQQRESSNLCKYRTRYSTYYILYDGLNWSTSISYLDR